MSAPDPRETRPAANYTPFDPARSVAEIVRTYSPPYAIDPDALEHPGHYLVTGMYERAGRRSFEVGLSPFYLASATDYRRVGGRTMFRCPVCDELVEHRADHDPAEVHRKRRSSSA